MRKLLAVLLAGLFLILFFVATTVNQVVDTASDPGVINGMLDDADAYNYVYDNIIGNLVSDFVEQGIEVDTGLDSGAPSVLRFEDPDQAALAITDLIETLIPREYVQEKLEASLNGVLPYVRGETDEFTIDLEVQERVRSVPGAVRKVAVDLELTERVIEDLLIPQMDQFVGQISTQGLGIEFTTQEIETSARLVFEPEWLEGQIFGAIDEVTPFFAGDSDKFNIVLRFDDRAVIIGEVLKNKLVDEDTLYDLVFNQVIDPLIQQTVAQTTDIGFGISLTDQEVVDTFEIIAPRAWVSEQGEGVIDALIDYLVGKSNSLEYTVELSDQKATATTALQDLARAKLEETIGTIPNCSSPLNALGAAQDLASLSIPRCIAGGQTTINLILGSFGPIIDAQVASFVEDQVPNEIAYTRADIEAQIGGSFDTLDDVRARIVEGVSFSDQDLIAALADDSDAQSLADAEETLLILANGILITEKNITDNLQGENLQMFDDVRDYAGTALSVRWLLWVLVLIPLAVIALIGGRGWAGRLKWAGGVAAVCALLVYGGIAIAWSMNDIAQDYVPDYVAELSQEFRADYPRLTAELETDELTNRFERSIDSWQQSWRNQTVPWIIGGLIAFAAGTVLSIRGSKKTVSMGSGTAYKGSTSSAASSDASSIPKDWGDEKEEDSEDSKIESDHSEDVDAGQESPPDETETLEDDSDEKPPASV
ncbi:MAG: hypothetical protein O2921_04910 [Chloroflexi bacterium]|jgi:hypothetical protein|nr:hypothetical protein [Chloroflexota bacterium]MDA1281951.1 hypothetical protein [Chloroflexota bacterium]